MIRPEFRHPLERPRYVPRERTPEIRQLEERFASEDAAAAAAEKPIELMTDRERYALWLRLRTRLAAGEQLDERMAEFYAGYSETGEIYLRTEQELDMASNGRAR